jgi:tetratricopeptide (TPR) repeat protein
VRLLYSTDYAHANYYYGRLLREHGDHPAAMEAFLRTVHSRTRDHAIKGRAYCNMGIMAGLATEHELAYNVYKCSAEEFLTAQDTTAYYYALIDMAFELAENKQKDEAIALTNTIECECNNYDILTKIWETRADAYIQAEVYDSAVYCVKKLHARGNQEPTGYLYAAQAYYWLGQNDSALYYANKTMEISNYHGDKFNVLYILSHCDSTLTMDDILTLTSEREDIRYYEYEPMREAFIQAAQLLEQDLNRKPDLRWLIAIIATSIVIGIGIIVYVRKKKRQHRLISQQIEDEQQNIIALKSQLHLLNEKQEHKQAELQASVEKLCALLLRSDNLHEIGWQDYPAMCEEVNARFNLLIAKLQMKGIVSERELRLCVLTLIGHGRARTAELLNYSPSGIGKLKDMTAKKMGSTGKDLHDFLLKMVLDE